MGWFYLAFISSSHVASSRMIVLPFGPISSTILQEMSYFPFIHSRKRPLKFWFGTSEMSTIITSYEPYVSSTCYKAFLLLEWMSLFSMFWTTSRCMGRHDRQVITIPFCILKELAEVLYAFLCTLSLMSDLVL